LAQAINLAAKAARASWRADFKSGAVTNTRENLAADFIGSLSGPDRLFGQAQSIGSRGGEKQFGAVDAVFC
jgi:hypothetical protein